VLDEEVEQHRQQDEERGDAPEGGEVGPVLVERHAAGLAERLLHQVVELAEPLVDPDIEADLQPGAGEDGCGAEDGPDEPAAAEEEATKHAGPDR